MSGAFRLRWNRRSGVTSFHEGTVAVRGDLVIAWVGRLHDRDDLAARCGLGAEADVPTLLEAAYCHWDTRFTAEVIGEYAVVLADHARGRLIVGGDALGLWQVYIHERADEIEIVSDLALIADQDLPLSRAYFAHYLASGHLTTALTPYEGVVRTVPGVSEICERQGRRSERVWSLAELERVEPIAEAEAASRLRDLLARAMRNAIDPGRATLVALSGGLDSSTVAAVAAHAGLTGLTAYSLVHPTTPDFDESAWAKTVVDRYDLPWRHIDLERVLPFGAFPDAATSEPSISLLHQPQREAIERIRAEAGADAVLTGSGGDVVLGTYIGSYPTFLTDSLFAGAFGTTWRSLRAWRRDCVVKRSLRHWAMGSLVRPSLLYLSGRRQDTRPVLPPPDYMLIGVDDLKASTPSLPHCRSPWLQMIAELLQKSAMSIASSRGAGRSLDLRTPLLYLPLVKFMLTLPVDYLYRSNADRYLQRIALKGILPEKVRRRAGKTTGSWSLIEGLRQSRAWRDVLCDRSILAEMGLIDLAKWRQAVAMAQHGNTQGDMYLMATASAEAWLRMRESGGGTANGPGALPGRPVLALD